MLLDNKNYYIVYYYFKYSMTKTDGFGPSFYDILWVCMSQHRTPSFKLDSSKQNKKFTIVDKNIYEIDRFNKPFFDDFATFDMRIVLT